MDLHLNVTEYFHGAVTSALKAKEVAASEPTEFYLVTLLTDFMSVHHISEEPIALKMAQAKEAPTPEARARALKEIGDTTLYMSGFHAERIAGRHGLVDVDYYISMGGAAYGQLASLVSATRGSAVQFFREAYAELSQKFADFVEVLAAVREGTSPEDPVKLWEKWVRSGSVTAERRLRESGVILGRGRSSN